MENLSNTSEIHRLDVEENSKTYMCFKNFKKINLVKV